MIPAIAVRMGDSAPITVEPTTNGLWLAEDTLGSINDANRWGILLTVAYYGMEGEPDEAVGIAQVRAWARTNSVRITEIEEDTTPDPT